MNRRNHTRVYENTQGHSHAIVAPRPKWVRGNERTTAWNPTNPTGTRRYGALQPNPVGGTIVLVLLFSLASPVFVHAQGSGQTGRTRVLFIGAAELLQGIPGGPYWHMLHDPFFDATPVRAFYLASAGYSDEIITKAVRAYMPRNYQQLLSYQVVSFFYADRGPFESRYAKWISDAVQEEGAGLVFTGHGHWAFDWMATTIGDTVPIQMINPQYTNDPTTIKIVREDHPLISSLPWSSIGEHGVLAGHSFLNAKEGAEVLARLAPAFGPDYPFLVWWDVGRGRSIAMMTVFSMEENPFLDWELFPDLTANLHLYAAGREIPPDPEVLHLVRIGLEEYHIRKGLLVSFVEFISTLGGNPSQVERAMDQTNSRLGEVEDLYLSYDFGACLELVEANTADLAWAENLAMKVKDQALLWIYLIEWTVLTSTGLVAGVVAWVLMVKRRLYAEVKTTKLAKTGAALICPISEATQDE